MAGVSKWRKGNRRSTVKLCISFLRALVNIWTRQLSEEWPYGGETGTEFSEVSLKVLH